MKLDPYRVLGVAHDATDEAIAAAYKAKAHETHPDRAGAEAHERMVEINVAYDALKTSEARAKTDAALAASKKAGATETPFDAPTTSDASGAPAADPTPSLAASFGILLHTWVSGLTPAQRDVVLAGLVGSGMVLLGGVGAAAVTEAIEAERAQERARKSAKRRRWKPTPATKTSGARKRSGSSR